MRERELENLAEDRYSILLYKVLACYHTQLSVHVLAVWCVVCYTNDIL